MVESTWITHNTFTERYRLGEWRSPVFRDMVAESVAGRVGVTVLDIGCGNGFDGDEALQRSLAKNVDRFLGVEPDPDVVLAPIFSEVYRSILEEAPIAPGSVDVAYCNMVLEHVADPKRFFNKLSEILKPGGIFWGFTVDVRHVFCRLSAAMERSGIKDRYLNWLLGERGRDRYLNYPTHYLCNSPEQLAPYCAGFSHAEFTRFHRPDVLNYYLPRTLRPLSEFWNSRLSATQKPGYMLAVKLVK